MRPAVRFTNSEREPVIRKGVSKCSFSPRCLSWPSGVPSDMLNIGYIRVGGSKLMNVSDGSVVGTERGGHSDVLKQQSEVERSHDGGTMSKSSLKWCDRIDSDSSWRRPTEGTRGSGRGGGEAEAAACGKEAGAANSVMVVSVDHKKTVIRCCACSRSVTENESVTGYMT